MDEKAELQALQSEYRKLGKLFEVLGQVRSGQAETIDQLEKALKGLPAGETLGRAVDDLRSRSRAFVERARHHRAEVFRRIETEFVREARANQQFARELDSGWRIGPLEFAMRREQSRVRVLYNHETLIEWSPVGSRADLDALQARALSMLEKAALPEDVLARVFWDAYQQLCPAGRGTEPAAMTDFYREVRVALVRCELRERKPDARLLTVEFPRWSFLYNVDRYRATQSAVEGKRLGFQVGSQQETRTKGMVINGLDPQQDTRVVCYVIARSHS